MLGGAIDYVFFIAKLGLFGYLIGLALWILLWCAVLVLAYLADEGIYTPRIEPDDPEIHAARMDLARRMLKRTPYWLPAAVGLFTGDERLRGDDDTTPS